MLYELLHRRVKDGGLDRLIGKWLNTGVIDGKEMHFADKGTPQGAVISPLLANIYLHYVLDEWFVKEIQPRLKGKAYLTRFADDFVIAFEYREDAERVMKVLARRFERFKLMIHPKKTRLATFRRPPRDVKNDQENETFDFLGFTHYLAKSRQGSWVIKRRTARKRLRHAVKALNEWCRENRHLDIREQHRKLCQKLKGHYQYYGIRCNYRSMEIVFNQTIRIWRKWLSRRSDKAAISWEKFKQYLAKFVLPAPRIVHQFV